jgi:hypothetical protein
MSDSKKNLFDSEMQINSSFSYLASTDSFLFHEEPLEEMFRERSAYLKNSKKSCDTWIQLKPEFLKRNRLVESSGFYKKSVVECLDNAISHHPYPVLISTNKSYLDWLQLRLGYFENINTLEEHTFNIKKSEGSEISEIINTLNGILEIGEIQSKENFQSDGISGIYKQNIQIQKKHEEIRI